MSGETLSPQKMKPEDRVDLLLFDEYVDCPTCKLEFKPKEVSYIKTKSGITREITCPDCGRVFYET